MKKKTLVKAISLALAFSMSALVACGNLDKGAEENKADNEGQVEASMAGTYVHSYTDELDGETVDIFNTIVLNDDNTCEVTFQDTVAGKWDENKIMLDDGSEFEYKMEEGNLLLNQDGVWNTYYKEE